MKRVFLMVALVLLGSSGAWALGTTAGTRIDNNVTLSYSVQNVNQPTVSAPTTDNGSADSFVVDKKIDMVMATTNTGDLEVAPGQPDVVRNFTFQNEGNADQNFSFWAGNVGNGSTGDYSGGGSDDQDVKKITKISWSGDVNCTGDSASGTRTTDSDNNGFVDSFIIVIPKDCKVAFTVKSTIPKRSEGGVDKQVMVIELNATAVDSSGNKETNTTTADNDEAIDTVLADGVSHGTLDETNGGGSIDTASDAIEKARSGYIIKTPELSVEKSSCVIWDPVNLDGTNTNPPKRIPGAIIRYLFDIKNTGTGTVNDLKLTDEFNDYLDLSNTDDNDHVKKDENANACDCSGDISGKTGIESDTTINTTQNKMTIEKINVDPGTSSNPKHTCVWAEVEIK